jgi:hypothetical protein
MLAFATEFPIERTRTSQDFLACLRGWILGSPHTEFTESKLAEFWNADRWSIEHDREHLEGYRYLESGLDVATARYTRRDEFEC